MDSYSIDVMHVTGKLVPLTFRSRFEQMELLVNGVEIANVNLAKLRRWLGTGYGSPRPLVDLPVHLKTSDLGVWLEVYRHIAPTLLERHQVLYLRALAVS